MTNFERRERREKRRRENSLTGLTQIERGKRRTNKQAVDDAALYPKVFLDIGPI